MHKFFILPYGQDILYYLMIIIIFKFNNDKIQLNQINVFK